MKKKGFTLVELLAVIVILAVILTIAVPAVKKIVDSAKKKTAENDAIMIKGIAEKYYAANLDSDEELTGVDLTSNTLSYSGEKPSKGYLYFTEDGIAYGKMYLNGYCIEIPNSGETTSTKMDESKCDITSVPGNKTFSGTVTMTDPDGINYILYDGKDNTGKELCQVTRESATCNIKVSSGYMYAGVKALYSLTVTSSKGVKVTNVDYHTLLIEVLENNFELNIDQLQYFPNQ